MEKSFSRWEKKSSGSESSESLDGLDPLTQDDVVSSQEPVAVEPDHADAVIDVTAEKPKREKSHSNSASWSGVPIGLGSKDRACIEAVQSVVGVEVNGVFDRHTRDKVRTWQQNNGLIVTGTVDFKTWNAMFKA